MSMSSYSYGNPTSVERSHVGEPSMPYYPYNSSCLAFNTIISALTRLLYTPPMFTALSVVMLCLVVLIMHMWPLQLLIIPSHSMDFDHNH